MNNLVNYTVNGVTKTSPIVNDTKETKHVKNKKNIVVDDDNEAKIKASRKFAKKRIKDEAKAKRDLVKKIRENDKQF